MSGPGWHRSRRAAMEAKYGPRGACSICDSNTDLVWDHIDPSTKSANVSDLYHLSPTRIEAEIAKCRVLCRACNVRRGTARLRSEQVIEIRDLLASGLSLAEIGRRYRVNYRTIQSIRNRESWVWLGG